MSDDAVAPSQGAVYRLDELGWLQFERVCSLVLEAELGVAGLAFSGHADRLRCAVVDGPITLGHGAARVSDRLDGPVEVLVAWVAGDRTSQRRLDVLRERIAGVDARPVLLVTNLDTAGALCADSGIAVLGAREIGGVLDRCPWVRAAMPSVLGLRDLSGLLSPRVRERSSFDVEAAAALARVFWPTRAYARAREVLVEHRFVVLTGPPEMGKTAIARMVALAQMTGGWEAHECRSPEQLWRSFDPARRQVFVADDAFGSTEYRPDAAERWAQSLGRLLGMLDDEHWLIWTSRPAPLKAGLRRVRRERSAERFPSPGEVLVDAGDLDLNEKSLILFRHAKARGVAGPARKLVQSSALALIEHPHFTPERIRRLVSDRLAALQRTAVRDGRDALQTELEHEMATPTDAMRTSYRALEDEHRELLVALLDAPAGLIDERELAVVVRRHHPGGLSQPPGQLIDRLTDHFLRVTPLGIGWVHPSWRDLVIDELADDAAARRGFIAASGLHGAMLSLSREGGAAGDRTLPLIVDDRDWDTLGDRLVTLAGELEDHDLLQLLLALTGLRELSDLSPLAIAEARNLTACVLATTARRWDREHRALPVVLVEHWYALAAWAPDRVTPPSLVVTWAQLHPGSPPTVALERSELVVLDEWLTLARVLRTHDPESLDALGFSSHDRPQLLGYAAALRGISADAQAIADSIITALQELLDGRESLDVVRAHDKLMREREHEHESRWWSPSDIAEPPSLDPATPPAGGFTREDVRRVFTDL